MKAELMEKMLDAGFTKEEIFRIIEPDKEPAAAPAQEPTKYQAPAPAADETEKRLAGIEKSISDLIKTIQAENIKKDSFGGTPDSLEEQTDRIMASIIRPEPAKRKDE